MKIVDCDQRSEEWRALRAGRITASRVKDVLAAIKSGEAASRRDYRIQLVAERLTGVPQEQDFVTDAMQWGIDNECKARAAYQIQTGNVVREVGLILHDTLPIAASPDGLIDDKGALEIKCGKTATHVAWMLAKRVPPEHVPQIQMQLWLAERDWCDFVSFDPRLPEHLQLFVCRMDRDEPYIETLKAAVTAFNTEIETVLAELNAAREPLALAA